MAKYKNVSQAKNKRFNELKNNLTLTECSNNSLTLISVFFTNTNYLLKQRKSNYTQIQTYYANKGIKLNRAYIYSLSKLNKYKTCNTLILSFIASYLNIPLINLLTIDYTLNDNIKPIELNDTISSF